MKMYLTVAFAENKLFWSCVIALIIFGFVMKYVLLDSYTAWWIFGVTLVVSIIGLIGGYICMKIDSDSI